MKNTVKLLLPVLLASIAVGFMLYRNLSLADEPIIESSDSAPGDQYGVPSEIVYTKNVESVVFSHRTHVVDHGFKCNVCHESLFQMKANNIENKSDFDMKGLAEGKYCGSCHSSESQVAFSAGNQCARCHQGVKGLLAREKMK